MEDGLHSHLMGVTQCQTVYVSTQLFILLTDYLLICFEINEKEVDFDAGGLINSHMCGMEEIY